MNHIFQIAEHKTNHIYGAVRVNVFPIRDELLKYGKKREKQHGTEKFFHLAKPFGAILKNFKKTYGLLNLSISGYRKFIETNVSIFNCLNNCVWITQYSNS